MSDEHEELEKERAERARLQTELDEATRMVAILALKAGGKVSVSQQEAIRGYRTITTTPNILTGGLDIEVTA